MQLTENDKRNARDLQHLPPSPVKLTRLVRLFEASVNELPLDANAPAPVSSAHAAFEAAVARAKQKIEQVESAEQAAKQAPAHDAAAAAEAMRTGKPAPKASQVKADEAFKSALLDTEGAARLLETAHDALVEAVKDEWVTWRAQLISDADSARKAAVGAMEKATAAVAAARTLYAGVRGVDLGVLSRYPKILEAVSAERRGGLAWYSSTCNGQPPLQSVKVPDPRGKGATVTLDLSKAAESLLLAVAEPDDFTQADEWLPLDDAGHDALLSAPLDLEATWVKAAVRREWGSSCAVCHYPGADTVQELTGLGLVMVCAKCRDRKPDKAEQQRAERLAKASRNGYPENPQAGAWRKEQASQKAENAAALARGGPDVVGDANAAMIAKHQHSDD